MASQKPPASSLVEAEIKVKQSLERLVIDAHCESRFAFDFDWP
jgi:hypothetical protein